MSTFLARSSLMVDRNDVLNDREKEALRLLLQGHDAKSIARELAISIHSVNERLRAARQKMSVTSSREAARLLGQFEESSPKFSGDKAFGLAASTASSEKSVGRKELNVPQSPIVFISGGILLMSLIIATVAMISNPPQNSGAERPARWSQINTASNLGSEVQNLIHLDGNSLSWNNSPITETTLKQYLDITTNMSPQPTVVFSYSAETKDARIQAIRATIEDVLQCTPRICKVVTPMPTR